MAVDNNQFVSDDVITQVITGMEYPPLEEVLQTPTEDVWEYKVVSSEGMGSLEAAEEQLRMLGLTRWELVSVIQLNIPFDNQVWYYLKRKCVIEGAENGE
jgi:hypothetical protein